MSEYQRRHHPDLAQGNTCDDANDAVGCIFTQKLLVEDATEDEIRAVSSANRVRTDAV